MMHPRGALFAAFLLAAPVSGGEMPADDAYDCPEGQSPVYEQHKDAWRCKPRLEKKRDVFSEEKNKHDPCPDGYWWQRNRSDNCYPARCTTDQNAAELKNLCGKGAHEHLSSGGDWTRPIVCVDDYKPENEKTGGKNPRAGGCPLCIFNKRGHYGDSPRPWAWEFEKAGGTEKEKKKRREAAQGAAARAKGPAGFNIKAMRVRAALAKDKDAVKKFLPQKASCGKGRASVPKAEGGYACVGPGEEESCPAGAGMFLTGDLSRPETCLPCGPGEESLVIDGRSQCLYNPCSDGFLPVRERGIVERYSCAAPVEKAGTLDWSKVLDPRRRTPAAAPKCGPGEGLSWGRSRFLCSACGRGREALRRGAHPACGRRGESLCPEGQVPAQSEAGAAGCQPCPPGSIYSADRGADFPRCLPQDAMRILTDAETRIDEKAAVPLLR